MPGLLSLVLWTAVRLARAPLVWAGLLLLWSVWGLVRVLSPIGLTLGNTFPAASFYEVAFLASLLGVTSTLGPLRDCRWLLERSSPARRAWMELAVLLSGSLTGLALGSLLPALVVFGGDPPGELGSGSLFGTVHLAALGLLALRAPLPGWLPPLALGVAAWVLPALAAGSGWTAWLDAARHWRPDVVPDTLGATLRQAAAVAAPLVLGLGLLAVPNGRGRARPASSSAR